MDLDDEELEATRKLHGVSKEIKVGEYVRNKQGQIFEIIAKDYDDYLTNTIYDGNKHKGYRGRYNFEVKNYLLYLTEEQLCECKHSKNIIDLIEEGDYVNGFYCKRIPNFLNKMCNFDLNTMEWTPLENIDIWYNILTKEQYNANCFTVKE